MRTLGDQALADALFDVLYHERDLVHRLVPSILGPGTDGWTRSVAAALPRAYSPGSTELLWCEFFHRFDAAARTGATHMPKLDADKRARLLPSRPRIRVPAWDNERGCTSAVAVDLAPLFPTGADRRPPAAGPRPCTSLTFSYAQPPALAPPGPDGAHADPFTWGGVSFTDVVGRGPPASAEEAYEGFLEAEANDAVEGAKEVEAKNAELQAEEDAHKRELPAPPPPSPSVLPPPRQPAPPAAVPAAAAVDPPTSAGSSDVTPPAATRRRRRTPSAPPASAPLPDSPSLDVLADACLDDCRPKRPRRLASRPGLSPTSALAEAPPAAATAAVQGGGSAEAPPEAGSRVVARWCASETYRRLAAIHGPLHPAHFDHMCKMQRCPFLRGEVEAVEGSGGVADTWTSYRIRYDDGELESVLGHYVHSENLPPHSRALAAKRWDPRAARW